ncbi:hypothetical protein XF24_00650 [candidate division SR1 bacterium Aalborg_AAW-1]|nr:hypothetical protein XF24_00650 [candidate division SR1 bacterium Aalborg_AAW-1]
MKKPLLIIIILILVGIGVAVFIKFPKTHIQQQKTALSGEIISSSNNTSGSTDFLSEASGKITSGTIQLVTGTTNPQSNNPLVYTNTEFGFQLILPKGWEEYTAFIYQPSEEVQSFYSGFIKSIHITLPTQESGWPGIPNPELSKRDSTSDYITGHVDVFGIIVRTPEGYRKEYQRCITNSDPSCSIDLLGFNNKYYFSYFGPQDIATDLVDLLTEHGGWLNYFQEIISTFKPLN